MIIHGSVKDFCIGMTWDEIEDKFQSNCDILSRQIWHDGIYYQLLCDEDVNGELIVVDVYAILN